MNCNLVKKTKVVGEKKYVNFYLVFDGMDVTLPIEVKELPMPKALEKNATPEKVKEYNEEVDFRKYLNNKFKTQLDTLATALKDE